MVQEFPDRLAAKCLYIAGESGHLWFVAMVCPCGCGEILKMSLLADARPRWTLNIDRTGLASLSPSIWRQVGCRSHFFLIRGRIK
jgi:hypothetical protein